MTLAIAHSDLHRRVVVLDAIREVKAPFSPEAVVVEFCTFFNSYRVYHLYGDNYAKLWPVEMFSRHGRHYEQNAQPKSHLYAALLPLINSVVSSCLICRCSSIRRVWLERSTRHGAADKIDHPPHGHDDVVNAVAGVAALCVRVGGYDLLYRAWDPNYVAPDALADAAEQPLAANGSVSAAYYKTLERQSWERYRRTQQETMLMMRWKWPW